MWGQKREVGKTVGTKNKPITKANQVEGRGPGKYGVGDRLYLRVSKNRTRSWMLNYTSPTTGKRREMGLGAYPDVSLPAAKELRDAANAQLKAGVDPLDKRDGGSSEQRRDLTFWAHAAFEKIKGTLKNDGKAGNWFSPLRLHVLPTLGERDITTIKPKDVREAIVPIWKTKTPTANKALDRLQIVLQNAFDNELGVDLKAVYVGRRQLADIITEPKHIPAMPYAELPDYYAGLSDTLVAHLALKLLILTGVRSAGVRFATPEQFDLDTRDGPIWTIPAERMKGRRGKTQDFRVPLSPAAVEVIQMALKTTARDGFLFPGGGSARRAVKPISDMAMNKAMRDQDLEYRPHGFRSSLKQWMVDETTTPQEVGETILAHVTETKTGKAYARGADYFKRRRDVMDQWAAFVTGTPQEVAETIQAPERLLKMRDVKHMTHMGKAEISELVELGHFPRSIPMGKKPVWSLSAVQRWITDRMNEAPLPAAGQAYDAKGNIV